MRVSTLSWRVSLSIAVNLGGWAESADRLAEVLKDPMADFCPEISVRVAKGG
jgi:hypothetical protein